MIIYGYRTVVRQLAMIMMVCSRCNMQTPHQLNKRVKKCTLFFIPLLPISIWHFTLCMNCGKNHTIRKAAAMQLLAQSQGGQPQSQPMAAGQPYPQSQPYPQQPYQPAINQQPTPVPQYAPQFAAPQQPHYDAQYAHNQPANWR